MFTTLRFWLSLAAICFVLLLVVGFIQDPFGMRKRQVESLQNQVVTSTQQADLAQATTNTVERVFHTTTVIRERQDAAITTVQEAPGADAQLAPDVRAAWRAGIDSVRNAEAAGPSDRDPAQPPF